jgi:hypothetical protein
MKAGTFVAQKPKYRGGFTERLHQLYLSVLRVRGDKSNPDSLDWVFIDLSVPTSPKRPEKPFYGGIYVSDHKTNVMETHFRHDSY